MNFVDKMIERFIKLNKRMKRWQRTVSVLSAVVVFIVTYSLVLPAITLDKETASTQAGMEVAASENEPENGGTVYEAEPEEEAEEPQEAEEEPVEEPAEEPVEESAEEPQAEEAVSEDSSSDSESKEAETEEDIPAQASEENAEVPDEVASNNEQQADALSTEKDSDNVTTEEAVAAATEGTDEEADLITEDTQLIYEDAEGEYTVYAEFDETAKLPVDVQLKVREITKENEPDTYAEYYDKTLSEMQDKYDDNTELYFARFYDITFVSNGVEIEPEGNVNVRIEYNKVVEVDTDANVDTIHFDKNNDEKPEVIESEVDTEKQETEDAVKAVEFKSDQFSVYGIVGTGTITTKVITASGDTYEISVTYGPEAEIPSGSSLKATEILEESKEYEQYFDSAAKALEEIESSDEFLPGLETARFFDVSIYDSEGIKIEPKSPVEVKITYEDPVDLSMGEDLKVVHFAEEGTEIIDVEADTEAVSEIVYEQNGFSVIGTLAITNSYGWPSSIQNPYVIILQDGDNYYAVAHDGTLRSVRYLESTQNVSFMGAGTTTLDYLDDYLWNYEVVSTSRHTSTLSYTADSGETNYVYPYYGVLHPEVPDAVIGPGRRPLSINSRKIYATYYNNNYYISADGGTLHRTTDIDEASTIHFAAKVSFIANDSESEGYDFIDIDTMIEEWQQEITQKLTVDKTAEVYDYENRIYEVDLMASSGYHVITPALALDFVLDASRSMFFPENIYKVQIDGSDYTFTNMDGLRTFCKNYADRSQTYYVIQDKDNRATLYAVFYHYNVDPHFDDMAAGWYYVDASYYYPPDNIDDAYPNSHGRCHDVASSDLGNLNDGFVYYADEKVAGKPWTRLDYMQKAVEAATRVLFAVNPEAEIGLVSFNSTAISRDIYTKEEMNELEDDLHDIALSGGTRHDLGLQTAVSDFHNKFSDYTKSQNTVVLITDGSPVGSNWSDPWGDIAAQANAVKTMTNSFGQNTRLFTLGLSLEHVGQNRQHLAEIATSPADSFDAESSTDIVNAIARIINGLVSDANLKCNITDVIDPAFYPVNPETGKPITSGSWIDIEGNVVGADSDIAAGQVIKENGTWKVVWTDQIVEWPTYGDEAREVITRHGWYGRVYVKAQEDFLGGNDINTNGTESKVEAKKYIVNNEEYDITGEDAEKEEKFITPYVNVDELPLDENSTEWTVYLGESVDPKTELQNLFKEIKVYEVVNDDGDLVYTLNEGSTTNPAAADKAKTGTTFNLSTLTGDLTVADWTNLSNGTTVTKPYSKYGHAPGNITISLEQVVTTGEDDITPSPHDTKVAGDEVEKYTLTVKYEPNNPAGVNYRTGSIITGSHGADTDDSVSTNTHVINVFKKGIQITKTDETFKKVLKDAKFVLYRTARDGDDQSELVEIDGLTGKYYPAAELDTSSTGVATLDWVEKLQENEKYYLVETEVPEGYVRLADPIEVTLTITEEFVPKPGTETQDTKPTSGIYDWTQKAVLTAAVSSYVKRTDKNNTDDLTHIGIQPDSNTVVLYYRIANGTGMELPHTGGPGTFVYTLCGLTLIAAAALMFGVRMRRR